MTPERLAELFHTTYEEVCEESADSKYWLPSGSRGWDEVPAIPRRIFVEICRRILSEIDHDNDPIKPKYPPWKR